MKNWQIILIFGSVLIGSLAIAQPSFDVFESENPENFCPEVSAECSLPMKQITDAFRGSRDGFTSQRMPVAYSGVCYHSHWMYDPKHSHHGLAVFVESESVPSYMGQFGFFYPEDPWQGQSSMQLLRLLKEQGDTAKQMQRENRAWTATFATEQTEIKYWFRSSSANTRLYLIGRSFAGGSSPSLVFCELRRH